MNYIAPMRIEFPEENMVMRLSPGYVKKFGLGNPATNPKWIAFRERKRKREAAKIRKILRESS